MCNLYRLDKDKNQLAAYFNAMDRTGNTPLGEVYPQYPGIVLRAGDAGHELVGMTWGFPLPMRGRNGQPLKPKAVNNARTDKLRTPFWSGAARNPAQRCLIPLSAFAEAVGETGKMTRTWLAVAGADPFACAGLWRKSIE